MFKKILFVVAVIIPTITYGQLATLEDVENSSNMANYYCSTDSNGKYKAGKEACAKARSSANYTRNAYELKDDNYEVNRYKEVKDIYYNDNVNTEKSSSSTESNLDRNFTDTHLDITESGKEAIKKDKQITAQREAISEIEKIQNGEGNYGSMSYEERQKLVDKQYEKIYANGGDANGLIGADNLTEAKESLKEQEVELEDLKQSAYEERKNFEKEFDEDQKAYDERVAKTNERTEILVNNAKALNDLKKNKETAKFESEIANEDAEYKERVAKNLELTSQATQKAKNEADQKLNNEKEKLLDAKQQLKEAKEGGATIEEIEKLKEQVSSAEKSKDEAEKKASEIAKVAEEAKAKAEEAKAKAEEAKAKAEEAKAKAEETDKSFEQAKETNSACVKNPDECKKVYSPQQIKKAKEEAAQKEIDKVVDKVNTECSKGDTIACREAIAEMNKAETTKACIDSASQECQDAKNIKDISDDVANDYKKKAANAAAQKEIDKGIDKVTAECSKGDSLACKEAIAEMNKAEAKKACIDPNSSACSEALNIAKMSEGIVEQTKANIAANPGLKTLGSDTTMNALLGITDNNVLDSTSSSSDTGGFSVVTGLAAWFKDNLNSLVQILSVGAFLFVGIRLAMARGNPEEFKKALLHMIYVILGIFIITVAWAAVVLVAGINI